MPRSRFTTLPLVNVDGNPSTARIIDNYTGVLDSIIIDLDMEAVDSFAVLDVRDGPSEIVPVVRVASIIMVLAHLEISLMVMKFRPQRGSQ